MGYGQWFVRGGFLGFLWPGGGGFGCLEGGTAPGFGGRWGGGGGRGGGCGGGGGGWVVCVFVLVCVCVEVVVGDIECLDGEKSCDLYE